MSSAIVNDTKYFFHIGQKDQYIKCKVIQTVNITAYLHTGLAFDGIPENTVLNIAFFLCLLVVFLVLKKISWSRRYYKTSEIYKIGWIGLLYRDVYDFMHKRDLQRFGSIYVPVDKNYSYLQMLKYSFYGIKKRDISVRCGVDATQYLTFHRYILYYMIFNAVVCMAIIMPANISGNFGGANVIDGGYFGRTTMANLSIKSRLMWCHVTVALIKQVLLLIAVRAIRLKLKLFERSAWRERTVLVRNMNEKNISSGVIEEYFEDNFPDIEIEDIKLVYDYQRFLDLDTKLRNAEDNLENCKYLKERQSRVVMVSEYSRIYTFFYRMLCCCKKVDKIPGEVYYDSKVKCYKQALARELNRVPKTVIPVAFVTFRSEASAHCFLATQPTNFFRKFSGGWIFSAAPEPTDIVWENVKKGYRLWTFRSFFINLAVFFVAFFVTSPGIILTSFRLDKLKEVSPNEFIVTSRFFVTALIFAFSMLIPTLIIYSSDFLEFKTKNSLYRSVVKKTYVFLAFSVVILPSLGQTTLDGFIRWTLTGHNQTYDWSCMFLVDNGVFFVDYVLAMTFIGVPVQLLKMSEIVWCAYRLLQSKSEAESVSIRKETIWTFSFGIQYAYSLLIFTVVIFFSMMCPIISIYGMMFFLINYCVDRYNIYFCYSPSKISQKIHLLVLKLVLVAMTFKTSGFFFLLYIRGGWGEPVTYVASFNMWVSIAITLMAANPCNCKVEIFDFLPLNKFKKEGRPADVDEGLEVYQPVQFRKYMRIIKHLDKYNNPLDPKDRTDFATTSRMEDTVSLQKYFIK